MSKSRFCPMCGAQAAIQANFCGSCGASLNSMASKKQEPSKANQTTFEPFSPDARDEDDSYIDRLEKLNVRISELEIEEVKTRQNKETIGSLVSQGGAGMDQSLNRGVGQYASMDKEKFLEEFRKEASNSQRPE